MRLNKSLENAQQKSNFYQEIDKQVNPIVCSTSFYFAAIPSTKSCVCGDSLWQLTWIVTGANKYLLVHLPNMGPYNRNYIRPLCVCEHQDLCEE